MLVPRRMLGQRGAPVGVALPAEKRSDRVTIVGQGNDFTNSLNVDEEAFRQGKLTSELCLKRQVQRGAGTRVPGP